MASTITESGPQLTEAQISDAERHLGRSIPSGYRTFLLKNNGGSPDPSEFVVVDRQTGRTMPVAVGYFLGIDTGEDTINLDYVFEVFGDRIPADMFPIARDPGGNFVCIAASGDDAGKVFYWDHEEESDDDEAPTDRNLYFVADNFDAFFDNLNDG